MSGAEQGGAPSAAGEGGDTPNGGASEGGASEGGAPSEAGQGAEMESSGTEGNGGTSSRGGAPGGEGGSDAGEAGAGPMGEGGSDAGEAGAAPTGQGGSDAGAGGAVVEADAGASDAGTGGQEPRGCDASAPPAVGALGLELVLSSEELSTLSYARQPPDSEDWYLVEQSGVIRVLTDEGLRSTPFYDVSSEIEINPTYEERGLHSIEFAPDYETSGLFYVTLTPTSGERANRDLVLEHRRSDADPYVADMEVTREILNLQGRNSSGIRDNIHNNYTAKFGPDGMLYVGSGDGGGICNDNPGFEDTPQDIGSTYGKILRFDLSEDAPYAAADNPFVGTGDPRVLHYGLRNPFRFSWDTETLDLYIGDVGQDTHEEISVAPAGSQGLNFGWATWEGGEMVCDDRPLAEGSEVTPPIFFTTHSGAFNSGCSTTPFCDYSAIVGGYVYHGQALPALEGVYLFGDWVGDNMGALYHCDGETSEVTPIDYVRDPNLPNDGYFVKVGNGVPDLSSITAIVTDHDQELYLVANGDSLLKIVPAP